MIENKQASFNYHVVEQVVAGMSLTSRQAKAIANKQFKLAGDYVKCVSGEMFLMTEKEQVKLLMTRKQIDDFAGKVYKQGMTLVPIRVIVENRRFKLVVGLCKGKKEYDKRADSRSRDMDLEANRIVKSQKFVDGT